MVKVTLSHLFSLKKYAQKNTVNKAWLGNQCRRELQFLSEEVEITQLVTWPEQGGDTVCGLLVTGLISIRQRRCRLCRSLIGLELLRRKPQALLAAWCWRCWQFTWVQKASWWIPGFRCTTVQIKSENTSLALHEHTKIILRTSTQDYCQINNIPIIL